MAPTDPANKGEQDVFGSLPSSRPQRRSAKRASAGAAKPKASAAKPRVAARPKAAAKPKPKAQAKPKATTARPQAKRSTVPPAGYATPRNDEVPSGRGDLIGTAVQAAGEIAQIGVAAGTRALSSALKRLPRP